MWMLKRLMAGLLVLALTCSPALAAPKKPLANYGGGAISIKDGDTLQTPAATTANASLNLPQGTAPTSPVNGDIWLTTAGMYARVNGSTVGPFGSGGTPGGSSGQLQYNNAGAFGGVPAVNGDGTLNTTTGALAVTKTGGVSFATSATTNTTNAANISSGDLPAARISTNLSAAIDSAIGSTRGSILERGASAWVLLTPGTSGNALVSNGAGADPTYQAVGAGAGGAMTLISSVTTASSQNNVTFSTIPGTYKVLSVKCIGTATGTNNAIFVQLNSDTAAHYSWSTWGFGAGGSFSGSVSTQTGALAGVVTGGGVSSGPSGTFSFEIIGYASSVWSKNVLWNRGGLEGTTNPVYWQAGTAIWTGTAAVTTIKLYTGAGNAVAGGNWSDGSMCWLWGIN
jgi:hypothetical protein